VQALRLSVIAIAAYLCAATSPPRYSYPRSYPLWKLDSGELAPAGCAELRAWVSKSGKQGVGVTLRLSPRPGAPKCDVRVVGAGLDVGRTRVAAARLPEPVTVGAGPAQHVYLPFAFDNEAAWNRGDRSGALVLQLTVDGALLPDVRVAMKHERSGAHTRIDRYARQPEPAPQPQPEPAPQPLEPARPPQEVAE
jgi:hypothetical protein